MIDIKIPFLGDGIDTANVVSILVKPGDTIAIDDTLLELETDKATAPVPSTVNGTVTEILIKEDDTVKEGVSVIRVSESKKESTEKSEPQQIETPQLPQVTNQASTKQTTSIPSVSYQVSGDITAIKAAPSIKKFALLSNLDLTRISGSGHGNRITWEDVKKYITYLQHTVFSKSTPTESITKKTVIDFAKFGPVKRIKVSSLRQKISAHLSSAWNEIPHVTQFANINIDSIMTLRKSANSKLKKADIKLSVTIFICYAIVETLKKFPNFNSSLDQNELVLKQYYHLGIAVDTDAGLVVPVVKDIDKKSLQDIAKELDQLAQKARDKKLSLNDIQGATFTLSNLGGLGAAHFTPIVNSPEAAILGIGRATFHPSYDEKTDKITNKLLMPVALSYDHRIIDGADAARFIQELTINIEEFNKEWVK